MPRSVITLTTDFGPSSPYVGQMKGVILAIHDDVELVDITHAIPPQQVLAGAVALLDAYHYFPPGTIHVAVVDPGVGTDRAILLAEMDGHLFVAPDNGLLSLVARRTEPNRIVRLEAPEFWNQPVAPTFHGRDMMAPVAAHLARGVDFTRFGPEQLSLTPLKNLPEVVVDRQAAEGNVLTIDAFGNVVTSLEADVLPATVRQVSLQIDDQRPLVIPVVTTYADRPGGEAVLLVGSNGRLELAIVDGNAAMQLGAGLGSRIALQWKGG